ncbi:transcription factor [Thraustotheca clavata]|uniref:Transcription factor n=1 Tax=Thraustotheca clavata TaxID=74557 RepID=A0A1V9YUW5_9STRA|nr:transcription factor [Thraustotheca clavata]
MQLLVAISWMSEEDATCKVCGQADNEEQLMLCDGCDGAFHSFCHHGCVCCQEKPRNNFKKTYAVPEGDWFCKFCADHIPKPKTKALSSVFAWGDNEDGQLGIGETEATFEPKPIAVNDLKGISVRSMAGGESFSLVLSNEGDMYSVGTGTNGQLGHNDVVHEKLVHFRKIEALQQEKRPASEGPLSQVQCGKDFALVVTKHGHVYTWGNGELGQLGHQENKNKKTPKKISALREKEIPVVLARCGADFTIMISGVEKEDDYFHRELPGVFMSMGGNANGQLADGTGKNQWVPQYLNPKGPATTDKYNWSSEPPQTFLLGRDIAQIALGNAHGAIVLKNSPGLWTWGFGEFGQLGHVKPPPPPGQSRFFRQQFRIPRPYSLEAFLTTSIKQVSCGANHTLFITSDNKVFAMGDNEFGQLGTEDIDDNSDNEKLKILALPTEISSLKKHEWIQCHCGESHSMVLNAKGQVFSWGKNDRGQLGLGNTSSHESKPTKITTLPVIKQLYGGYNHTFALEFAAKIAEKKAPPPARRGRGGKTKTTSNRASTKLPSAKRQKN